MQGERGGQPLRHWRRRSVEQLCAHLVELQAIFVKPSYHYRFFRAQQTEQQMFGADMRLFRWLRFYRSKGERIFSFLR